MPQIITPIAPAVPLIPDINGIRYDFSSLEINLGGSLGPGSGISGGFVIGIQSINYEYELMPGEARGTAAQMIGRGRGLYKAKADFTVYAWEAQNLITALAITGAPLNKGFMEVAWDLKVDFADVLQPVLTDFLRGNRITKVSAAFKNDQNILVKKFETSVPYAIINGCYPFAPGTAGVPGFFPG